MKLKDPGTGVLLARCLLPIGSTWEQASLLTVQVLTTLMVRHPLIITHLPFSSQGTDKKSKSHHILISLSQGDRFLALDPTGFSAFSS